MELREGAIIADRFRLMRLLGKGGMGEVWAAQHTSLDIPCAVKFIHANASTNPEVRARFEREAKAAAQLRTPNVVQILDYGVFEGTPYIAMEYLDGEPLNARLERRGRLDPAETLHVVTGIAKALQKAHAAGIVHRDLKPENVFLVQDIDGETPKVLDFGVAKQADTLDSNTKTGALLGTPYYMSPEQAQGTKTVDHRADLWSLGVLTFRCLTGELPFKSTALGDLLIKIVTQPIPAPSHVVHGLPPGFDGWWARAAERDPNRRFQNAAELVQALAAALSLSSGRSTHPSLSGASFGGSGPQAGISMQGGTVVADPSFSPGQFSQSGASQMMPPPAGSRPSLAHTTPMPYGSGPYPQPTDYQGASMAGVTATASAPSRGSRRIAIAAAVLAVLGLGGVGAFFAIGSAATGEPSASEAAATEPPDDATNRDPADDPASGDGTQSDGTQSDGTQSDGTESVGADQEEAGDDERDSQAADATEAPTGGSPPAPAMAQPPPVAPRPLPPKAPPSQLDVPPKSPPKPTPKPSPDGFDPGF